MNTPRILELCDIYKRAYETLYLYIRRADMLPDYIYSSGGFSIRKQETAIPNYRAEYRRRAATRYHSESGRLQQRVYQRRTRSSIDFEKSTDNNYVRTANFYFPTIRTEQLNPCPLDKVAQDTIIRIDRPEDLARFKQSGKTLLVNGVLKEGGKPVSHAEISIQGTGKRTFSNVQREFSIEADYSHLIMIRAERMGKQIS